MTDNNRYGNVLESAGEYEGEFVYDDREIRTEIEDSI